MTRNAINAPGAATVGPYSHAVDAGELVFLSGLDTARYRHGLTHRRFDRRADSAMLQQFAQRPGRRQSHRCGCGQCAGVPDRHERLHRHECGLCNSVHHALPRTHHDRCCEPAAREREWRSVSWRDDLLLAHSCDENAAAAFSMIFSVSGRFRQAASVICLERFKSRSNTSVSWLANAAS